jgi:hypothetical protein
MRTEKRLFTEDPARTYDRDGKAAFGRVFKNADLPFLDKVHILSLESLLKKHLSHFEILLERGFVSIGLFVYRSHR